MTKIAGLFTAPRVAVALLFLIWLQLGGLSATRDFFAESVNYVKHFGAKEEAAAPSNGGGLLWAQEFEDSYYGNNAASQANKASAP